MSSCQCIILICKAPRILILLQEAKEEWWELYCGRKKKIPPFWKKIFPAIRLYHKCLHTNLEVSALLGLSQIDDVLLIE